VLAINIERAPSHFRSENRAQFSIRASDSIAISGARKSGYWPANVCFFVIAGTANGEIGTAWRREGDLNFQYPLTAFKVAEKKQGPNSFEFQSLFSRS
jgi:hypothetical protein